MIPHTKLPDEGILTAARPLAATTAAVIAMVGSSGAAALPLPLGSIGLLAPQLGIALGVPILPAIGVAALGGAAILAASNKKLKKLKRKRKS